MGQKWLPLGSVTTPLALIHFSILGQLPDLSLDRFPEGTLGSLGTLTSVVILLLHGTLVGGVNPFGCHVKEANLSSR